MSILILSRQKKKFSSRVALILDRRFRNDSDFTEIFLNRIRLRLHDDALNRRRKSGVVSSHFIPRLDERFREEICVHTVKQKCVEFDWVCMSGGIP